MVEAIFPPASPAGHSGPFALFQAEGWLLGVASVSLVSGLEATTEALYSDMFHAARGLRFARIWNYVPAINAGGGSGLENYQVFCRGRSLAFERHFGAGFKTFLPAASAVGSKTAELSVVFAACQAAMRHVENPLQVSAYDYPREYGPRAPSFARATIVRNREQATVFFSGTAAIRGHGTVAPHDTRHQLDCTLENLRELSVACGLGPHLDTGCGATRHFKVYLRHVDDQPWVAAALEERLLQPRDLVSYLQADLCRAQLNVEIEATLCPPFIS
ncbi:MAG: hypothetical protein EXS19_03610 [Pedosphaera sp.]|nr:hypothetical protein [Pedosphaera sp.]